MELADSLRKKIRFRIGDACGPFSCTSDMWTSQSMQAYMALTPHYITADFKIKNITLEAKLVLEKHTGEMIENEMRNSFLSWKLDLTCLTMMVRDSGFNMLKACKNWNVPHFLCIGHSLHLLVGPLLISKKKATNLLTQQKISWQMKMVTIITIYFLVMYLMTLSTTTSSKT